MVREFNFEVRRPSLHRCFKHEKAKVGQTMAILGGINAGQQRFSGQMPEHHGVDALK